MRVWLKIVRMVKVVQESEIGNIYVFQRGSKRSITNESGARRGELIGPSHTVLHNPRGGALDAISVTVLTGHVPVLVSCVRSNAFEAQSNFTRLLLLGFEHHIASPIHYWLGYRSPESRVHWADNCSHPTRSKGCPD